MFEFHADRKRYFNMQLLNAREYVVPFIEEKFKVKPGMRVLEIGAGEGGVIKAFINKGCVGVAVELDETRVEDGRRWLNREINAGILQFFVSDIYNTNIYELGGPFEIIVLKDVIEHIHDQARLLEKLHEFLKPNGVIFFGFPPWQMPYGGHQQMCEHFLAKVPYMHLLPASLYKRLLKLGNESPGTIDILMEVKETGISIETFEKILSNTGYETINMRHYAINPIYRWKFGWKPIVQSRFISKIPVLRNYITTCVFYLVQNQEK